MIHSYFYIIYMREKIHSNIKIKKDPIGEQGLFATKNIAKDEVVFLLEGEAVDTATRYTIQVGDIHINDDIGRYLNHSCDPNTYIKVDDKSVRASRDIADGEEISFDYNENEFEMATPFHCKCGSGKCRGEIRGSKFL